MMLHRIAVGLGIVLAVAACGSTSTPEERAAADSGGQPVEQSPPGGEAGGMPPQTGGGVEANEPPGESGTWKTLRFDDLGLALRVPGEYVELQPAGELQPEPAQRLWLGPAREQGSSVPGGPPSFAVDVYDNANGLPLDDWLEAAGIRAGDGRWSLSPARVAGRDGRLLAGSAQMAPNAFYYVAVGVRIFRFTPLGPDGERILADVELSPIP